MFFEENNEIMADLPVTYEFITSSTPINLVHQYFQLRQDVFTDYWKLKNFSGGEDDFDKLGHILLLIQGDRCVGGIRLVTRKPYTSMLLPMETENFQISNLLPELALEGETYSEICRAALLPDFRKDGRYSKEMYRLITLKSKELKHKVSFGVSPVVVARKIRIACKSFGLHTEIRNDIKIPSLPSYENIEMRLSVIYIDTWDAPNP